MNLYKISNIKSKILFGFLVFGFLFLILIPARQARAAAATLYLSPSSGSFLVGSTFTVSVYLNTNGGNINTVWTDLRFPPDILQVASPTTGNSFITEWLTPPNYSNQQGLISFRGGIPGGISTSAGLVSSVTFRTISTGKAKIEFGDASKILLHDGLGTDILRNRIGGEYQVLVPPPEGPKVFSPTHPDPNVWYSDSSPEFTWEKEDGVSGYSFSLSQNPQERPNGTSEGVETLTSFDNTSDGIFYFHIRQQKNGIWGNTSHVQVKIDVSPPAEFFPRVITYSRLVGYQTMVYFDTADAMAGISHYEAGIIDLEEKAASRSFFTEQISPYKIPNNGAGKYSVIIKAVDNAGNIRESEARFRLMTPLISHIEGNGLEIRGIFLPWWIFWFSGLVFALISAFVIWRILALKRKRPI